MDALYQASEALAALMEGMESCSPDWYDLYAIAQATRGAITGGQQYRRRAEAAAAELARATAPVPFLPAGVEHDCTWAMLAMAIETGGMVIVTDEDDR